MAMASLQILLLSPLHQIFQLRSPLQLCQVSLNLQSLLHGQKLPEPLATLSDRMETLLSRAQEMSILGPSVVLLQALNTPSLLQVSTLLARALTPTTLLVPLSQLRQYQHRSLLPLCRASPATQSLLHGLRFLEPLATQSDRMETLQSRTQETSILGLSVVLLLAPNTPSLSLALTLLELALTPTTLLVPLSQHKQYQHRSLLLLCRASPAQQSP